MMNFFLGLILVVFGGLVIKYREKVGENFGEPQWAEKIGGIYNVLIIVGVLLCFWGLATMTGTVDILFAPILWIFPG